MSEFPEYIEQRLGIHSTQKEAQQEARQEMVPSIPGRPGVVKIDGWTIYVGIRDAAYLRENRLWRAKIAAAHPDKVLNPRYKGGRFRECLNSYTKWKNLQRKEYWRIGELMPPDWRGAKRPPAKAPVARFGSGKYLGLLWKEETP